jgi:hypothetical protein
MTATPSVKTFAVTFLLVGLVSAQTTPNSGSAKATKDSPSDQWTYSPNLAGYIVPHDRSYASPTFSADRGRFHFGSRYNYEDKETGSLWLGTTLKSVRN